MATPTSRSTTPGHGMQYSYMFEGDKRPTQQLDALLRAMALFIVLKIGDRNELQLTPRKLAAFYKVVGGDYDSLFAERPDPSISYMWQVTGCQHTLQPTKDDFAPPSIPALTPRGFSRWESLEILLGPEEHVPFLQYAVKNWNLRHPETGEPFPTDLPASVFPSKTDEEVDLWHKSCGEKLTQEAASRPARPIRTWTREREREREWERERERDRASETCDGKFAQSYSGSTCQSGTTRSRHSDPSHLGRSFSYVNVPHAARSSKYGHSSRSPEKLSRDHSFNGRLRRRSFSDFTSPPPNNSSAEERQAYEEYYLDQQDSRHFPTGRRHSHPRHHSPNGGIEPEQIGLRGKRRLGTSPAHRRFSPPEFGHGSGPSSTRLYRQEGDLRRKAVPSPLGTLRNKLSETVSSIFPGGLTSERPRPHSRNQSSSEYPRPRRSREQVRPTRLNRSHSDLDSENESDVASMEDMPRRRRRPEERDRERYRDRGRYRSEAEREEERDSAAWRERERQYTRRPDVQRRTSSHGDVDRRRDQDGWDIRDRERLKEERKKWDRERERRSPPGEAIGTPPANGHFFSRRYAESAYS